MYYIIEDFYPNRDPRVYEDISPTLRSDRYGLKVAIDLTIEPLNSEEYNTVCIHKEINNQDKEDLSKDKVKFFSVFSGQGGFEVGFGIAEYLLKQGYNLPEATNQEVELEQLSLFEENIDTLKLPQAVIDNFGGFECVGLAEIDEHPSAVLALRFPGVKNYGDITAVRAEEFPDMDVLVGGFPCQDYSIAGKRVGIEGFRGQLVYELFRIMQHKQPKVCLFENVQGLLSQDDGKDFEIICEKICELGYVIDFDLVNTKFFRLPQNRSRVFVVAVRKDLISEKDVV